MTAYEVTPAFRTWQRVQLSGRGFHSQAGHTTASRRASILDPALWIYRQRTEGLLRRYFRLSLEVGRLPSALGREFFRARCNQHRHVAFEDAVIFVHDMEHCLEQLDELSQQVLVWVVLQGYSHDETSRLLGCARRTITRRIPEALDQLSEILLREAML
jgi:DNA-directed RNA polymerase specialized sigma24 family protein